MRRKLLASLMVGLLLPVLATANDSQEQIRPTRESSFIATQSGPNATARTEARYRPGRLMVQVTTEAKASVDRKLAMARSTGTDLGLASLDALNRQNMVREIRDAYPRLQNTLQAERVGAKRWYILEMNPMADIERVAEYYRTDPHVTAATPDYQAFPTAIPNDPNYSLQWGHNNTSQMLSYCYGCGGHPSGSPVGTVGFDANAQTAWDQGYGSSSVVIAIIDSGVDTAHPDLRLVAGYDYGDNDSNPMDNSSQAGHGTACAGVAAARVNNNLGVAGIAGGCSVMGLKVANSAGSMFFSAIQNSLYHAADNGADVASLSLGAAISSDPATDSALQYAFNAGVTILAATGNENASTISYPAINQYVIAVGAASPCGSRKRSSSSSGQVNPGVSTDPNGTTCDGETWWGSNYGTNSAGAAAAVDIIAPTIMPTTDISGTAGYNSGDYDNWFNGTSCATPYAAGVAALVISKNPTWTPTQVRNQLRNTAQDITNVESGSGWDRYSGYGMVDAAAAVGGSPPPPPPPPSGQDYATLPYTTGFEGGSVDEYWDLLTSSATYGRIQVTSSFSPRGSYQLVMDVNTNGNYVTNASDLHLDLSGESQVDLDFWWKEFGDETHSADGVYFSDNGGDSFSKVQNLNGQSYTNQTWQFFSLDLDALAAGAGLSLTSEFVVRFQQYDNYAATTDGHAIDDISVTAGGSPPPPPTSDHAQLPYYDGFESGTLGQYWSTSTSGNGRVRVSSTESPYAGSYQMLLDDSTRGGYSYARAQVDVDLSGHSQVRMDFRWKEFGDESHTDDGVYFSSNGGSNWTKVYNLYGQSYSNRTWQFFSLDVDQLCAQNGITMNGDFVIRFQQYDNYPIRSDGWAIDELNIVAASGGATSAGMSLAGESPLLNADPDEFGVLGAYPNPFNPKTTIYLALPEATDVAVDIFNIRGERVRQLFNGQMAHGTQAIEWDGRDGNDNFVPSGAYFYKVVTPFETVTHRMMLVK